MSTEFNYKRVWDHQIKPLFEMLSPAIHKALIATALEVEAINQIGASMKVSGQSKELTAMFDAIPTDELAWAKEVVYYYGHLAYGKQCQECGLYWKFQKLASMSLIYRKPYEGEVIHEANVEMERTLNTFHDHKEGTEYDNEEVPAYLLSLSPKIERDLIKIYKVDYVNHKPDVFCIGPRHFPNDSGMYIKPEQAPCYSCGQDYSAHTYDRVMFIKPIVNDDEDPDTVLKNKQIPEILEHIVELCKASKIKLDGFAFVRP